MSGINPPVNTTGCECCLLGCMNNAMFNGLFSIQNGRVIYQGSPVVAGTDLNIEDVNKAL
ncbi:Uncharacterised protein [Serratia fonticola]|nr:Uncharacterised protein [Serratia fonticola]